jgi:hypothetical protein
LEQLAINKTIKELSKAIGKRCFFIKMQLLLNTKIKILFRGKKPKYSKILPYFPLIIISADNLLRQVRNLWLFYSYTYTFKKSC